MATDDDPYLALAREIRAEVERVATEGGDLSAAFDEVPVRERRRVARAVFDRLAPDRQWEVLAALFADDELRDLLAAEHGARRDDQVRARTARLAGRLDLDALADGTMLTLGLFLAEDAQAALRKGRTSASCARRLVVRATPGPEVHVLEDVFNPERGLFVTPDYDQRTWAAERLASHDRARLGSLGPDGFEPVVYAGGRVDVDGRPGRLHLGYALIGTEEVFAATS